MISRILLLSVIIFILAIPSKAVAQHGGEAVKSHKVKNLKAWEAEVSPISTTTANSPKMTGPSAKNRKAWDKNPTAITLKSTTKKEHGASAKNTKVWEDEVVDERSRVPRFVSPLILLILLAL